MAWVVELYDDEITLQARTGGVVETYTSESTFSTGLTSASVSYFCAKGRGHFTVIRSATILAARVKLVHKGGKFVLILDTPL